MAQIKRILIPTDFSTESELAFEYGLDLASRYGASVVLLHVLEDPVLTGSYPDAYFVELAGMRKEMREEAARRLAELAKRCEAAKVNAEVTIAEGRAALTIAREAMSRGTDLIVMGTHGRSGFTHLLLGSVAEKVIRTAPSPVLTVRDTARVADALAQAAAEEPRHA